MLCRNPFIRDKSGRALHPANDGDYLDGVPFPCGQCLPCRINKRREWTHRIMLESAMHKASSFVTLTYDNDHLPPGANLVPRDMTLFLKRLRKLIAPLKIRYYYVGEYGEQTYRPHYHAILFGLGIEYSGYIQNCWPHGHIHVGDVTQHSAQYVCGYVVKKITARFDPNLVGREPEYSRMSTKPGIAASVIPKILDVYTRYPQCLPIKESQDVPMQLVIEKKKWPLGRYLINKLRDSLGYTDSDRESNLSDFVTDKQLHYILYSKDPDGRTFQDYLSQLDDVRASQLAWHQKNRQRKVKQ